MRKAIPVSTRLLLLCLCLPLPSLVLAEWTVSMEGGSVIRDGDTATRIRVRATQDERPLSHSVYAQWYRSDSDSYEFGYKPRYWFTSRVYGFGDGRLRIEEVLGIDRETLILGGVGIQLIATKTRNLWLEAGAGYRLIDYTSQTGLENLDEEVGAVRGAASQVLSDVFRLDLNADVLTSATYQQSQLEAGVSMRVPQGAIRLSHRIRRVDIEGLDAVDDSETALAFTVGF